MVNDQNGHKLDCKYCGKVFKSHHYVKTHEKWHEGELKHKCNYCGRNFRFPSELKKHNSIHTGEDPYKCETCGKGFGWAQTLNEHIRVDHGLQKHNAIPYKCETCGKGFGWAQTLNEHIRVEHALRKDSLIKEIQPAYVCVQCNQTFQRVELLNEHIKKEHAIPSTISTNVKQEAHEDSLSLTTSSLPQSVSTAPNHQSLIVSNNNDASKSKATIKQESFQDYNYSLDPLTYPLQESFSTPDISQNTSKEADQPNLLGLNNNKSIMDEALSLSGIFDPWQPEPSLTLFESFNPDFQSLVQPNPEYAPLLPMTGPLGATPFNPELMDYKPDFGLLNPAQQMPNRQAHPGMRKREEDKKKRLRRHAEVVSEDWRPDPSLPEGWMIRVHVRQNTRISGSYQRDVYYKAPCGLKIGSREGVVEYLRKRGASEDEVARVRDGYKNYKRKPMAKAGNASQTKAGNVGNASQTNAGNATNAVVEEEADCVKCNKIKEIETILQELRNHLC